MVSLVTEPVFIIVKQYIFIYIYLFFVSACEIWNNVVCLFCVVH